MSMISAQIDELRKYANKVDGTFPMLSRAMSDAADTIWELRDDLQRANAENADLRELVQQMYLPAKAHLQLGVTLGCNDTLSYDWALQMTELGIEVPE